MNMIRRSFAVLAALVILALPILAFGQDVPPSDFDPMVLLSALVKAVMAGQWPIALVMLFVGLVWALRKFGVKAWPWLATSEGGTALAFVTVLASVLGAAALAPGAAITWALVGKSAMLALTAIGGWTGVRRLLRLLLPLTAKVPWLNAIVVFLSGAEVPAKVETAAAAKYIPLPAGMTPEEAAKLLGAPPAGP